MTNLEFIKTSDKDTLAEVLVTLEIGLFNQLGMTINYDLILQEKEVFKKWLDTEIVSGEYIN